MAVPNLASGAVVTVTPFHYEGAVAAGTIFTVPSDETWIVVTFLFAHSDSSNHPAYCTASRTGSAICTRLPIAQGDRQSPTLGKELIFNEGDTLTLGALATAVTATYIIDGFAYAN